MSTVSVIIANWNARQLLADCLDSLRAQRRPADEILVIDNGSTDGSPEMLRAGYPEVTVVALAQNKGFAIANNIGIRRARGDYIALLNNDLVLDPAWMAEMVAALEAGPSLGSCASKMLSYDQRDRIDAAGISVLGNGVGINRGMSEVDSEPYQYPAPVFGACAGAALYRAALFRDIGLFDEDLYLYYEDVDLAFRAQLAGYDCLYVPTAVAFHHQSATGARSGTKDYYLARNSLLVVVKNMPYALLGRHLPRIVAGQLPYAFYAGTQGQMRQYVRACTDGLAMLPVMLRKRRAIQGAARRTCEEIAARLS